MVRMAEENRTWGDRRLQGALANLGHYIDAIPVRHILRRDHHGARPATAEGWHELATVSADTLGSPGRHGLFHGGGGDMAWAGHILDVGGDGAQHAQSADSRNHPASHRGLHAAVCPAVDCSL
jgi:hypothetical protein